MKVSSCPAAQSLQQGLGQQRGSSWIGFIVQSFVLIGTMMMVLVDALPDRTFSNPAFQVQSVMERRSLRADSIIPIIYQQTTYNLNSSEKYTIKEIEQKHSDSNYYTILYDLPIKFSTKSTSQVDTIYSMIALFTNGSKAYFIVDPYNVPINSNVASLPGILPLNYNETIYGSEFYIKKLLSWQGTDPNVEPQCEQLTNYQLTATTAQYHENLFYCSQLTDMRRVFTLNTSSSIQSKYTKSCLQYVSNTDDITSYYVAFQFKNCSSSTLQKFSWNGQFLSSMGEKKVLFVSDKKSNSDSSSLWSAPGAINMGSLDDLTNYGRNLQYPYRVYQFYLEPTSGFNQTRTIAENGPYTYPPLSLDTSSVYYAELISFINATTTTNSKQMINRLYSAYQKEKRTPFPVIPEGLLYTYIFLPIGVFIGGFVMMFFCVASCWIFVYIRKTYCKP